MLTCVACRNNNLSIIIKVSKGEKNMFNENLRNLRKQKGLSQEELAERLHIVRQTVSKWEKGLSIPDADFLIQIAEIFETSVSTLLGDTVEPSEDKNIIAQKLEQLNALLAEKNRRSRRIWKVVVIILISIAVMTVLLMTLSISTIMSIMRS
jgi:putative transcriptional regulator